jgi:hypothetical protein
MMEMLIIPHLITMQRIVDEEDHPLIRPLVNLFRTHAQLTCSTIAMLDLQWS